MSEEGLAIQTAVKANNPSFTTEEIEAEVISILGLNALNKARLDNQKLNLELGKPIEASDTTQKYTEMILTYLH